MNNIEVKIFIEDGLNKPFGGGAFANNGVMLSDALHVCHRALSAAGYGLDELVAIVDGKEVGEE